MAKTDFVSLHNAKDILGVSHSTVLRWCKQGRFEGSYKEGKHWFIPRTSVARYLTNPESAVDRGVRQYQQKQQKPIDIQQASKQLETIKADLDKTINKPRTIPMQQANVTQETYKNNGSSAAPHRNMNKETADEWLAIEKAMKLHRENQIAEGILIEKDTVLPQLKNILGLFANDMRELMLKTCIENRLGPVETAKVKDNMDKTFRKCFEKLQKVTQNGS